MFAASIVPRGLGIKYYGDFSYLENFYTQILNFFDTGTSIGYYTKISSRPEEYKMTRFYWGFYLISILIITLTVVSFHLLGFSASIWPKINYVYVLLAMFLGFITWGHNLVAKIIDAYALTTKGEITKIFQKVIGVLALFLLLTVDYLNLRNYYIFQYIILGFLVVSWWKILHNNHIPLFPKIKLLFSDIRKYSNEFYSYSSPLIVFAFFALIIGIFDRWILQYIYGSAEQGYFGLAFRISGLIFIFTSALTPLILREFSIEYHKLNIKKMRQLFSRYIPLLYFVAAFFAVFVSVHAHEIATLVGGSQFESASISLMIISFYPLHQTYGQLCGSLFYATGKTTLYRNIGILFMLIGLPLTFFLLAPKTMFGMNMGAIGLAIKMVVIQLVWVNALLWYNVKFLKLSFKYFLFHQITTVIILLLPALLVNYISYRVCVNQYFAFFISGLIYSTIVFFIVYFLPSTINMSRQEIIDLKSNLVNKIRNNGIRK